MKAKGTEMNIDEFIKKLSLPRSTDIVENMYYGNTQKAIVRRERLKKYLESFGAPEFVFVGEAPGYKGCARTGVPFTSDDGEMSATILTEAFKKELPDSTPLMWNAFPFHPHEKGNIDSNRKPTAKELEIGKLYMRDFMKLFPSVTYFFAVGRVSEKMLKGLVDERMVEYIRHPAYGGKRECELGVKYGIMRFFMVADWERLLRSTADEAVDPDTAYKDLKEHEAEFRKWYYEGDHDEYPWMFLHRNDKKTGI